MGEEEEELHGTGFESELSMWIYGKKLIHWMLPDKNDTSVAICTWDFGFYILFLTEKKQGSLEKWLIPGLGEQAKYNVSLEYFDVPESNEVGHVLKRQEPAKKDRPNMIQLSIKNNSGSNAL